MWISKSRTPSANRPVFPPPSKTHRRAMYPICYYYQIKSSMECVWHQPPYLVRQQPEQEMWSSPQDASSPVAFPTQHRQPKILTSSSIHVRKTHLITSKIPPYPRTCPRFKPVYLGKQLKIRPILLLSTSVISSLQEQPEPHSKYHYILTHLVCVFL